jgi:hypothetical protein
MNPLASKIRLGRSVFCFSGPVDILTTPVNRVISIALYKEEVKKYRSVITGFFIILHIHDIATCMILLRTKHLSHSMSNREKRKESFAKIN